MTNSEIESKIETLLEEARKLGVHYACGCGCGGDQLQEDVEELQSMLIDEEFNQ